MRFRATYVLLVLFFASLGALWLLEHFRVPDLRQQRALSSRILPELLETPVADIHRVELARTKPNEKIVVERRDDGRWQILAPVDTPADPNLVETLVRNLKDLQKSVDAGTIESNATAYGFDKPAGQLRLIGRDGKTVLARLDLGSTKAGQTYVRPGGGSAIEVVDARLLSLLARPLIDWRDRSIFRLPSFRLASVEVREERAQRELKLQRDERQWRIVEPVRVAADRDKAEGFAAELGAIHVVDGPEGFVNDNAADLAPYGLDTPAYTLTLSPFEGRGATQVARFGVAVPGKPGKYYASRENPRQVVMVDLTTFLASYGDGVNAFRSQTVVELNPSKVERIRVDAQGKRFDLAKGVKGWFRLGAGKGNEPEPADEPTITALLNRLAELKTSEYLDPASVVEPRLHPPNIRLRIWQSRPGQSNEAPKSADEEPKGELHVDLRLGRHDVLRKTIYGQVEGDRAVLALPDGIVDSLPRNEFAYRDLTLLEADPASFTNVSIEREGRKVSVKAPGSGSTSVKWRLTEPLDAPADEQAILSLLLGLANLRAMSWESATADDEKAWGLDQPTARVQWSLRKGPAVTGPPALKAPKASAPTKSEEVEVTQTLRIGKKKPGPGQGSYYATIEGKPEVFTINPNLAAIFDIELRDRKILALKPAEIERLRFRWPGRTLILRRGGMTPKNAGAAAGWVPETGIDATGFNFALVEPLLEALSDLRAVRFAQYEGPFPEKLGLTPPRLTLEIFLQGGPVRTLRLGALDDTHVIATTALGNEGPAFLLPVAEIWRTLPEPPRRLDDLPVDVFQAP